MKTLLRNFLFNAIGIFAANYFLSGIQYNSQIEILLMAAAALTIINFVIKPIIKFVTLPLNFLTFGMFQFVINALMLYLATIKISGFIITDSDFPGFSYQGFVIPAMHFSPILTAIIASFIISGCVSVLNWIRK